MGDVHSLQFTVSAATNIPLIEEIAEEPGLLLHLKAFSGVNYALGKKRIRFVDRYFLGLCCLFSHRRFNARARLLQKGLRTEEQAGR